MEYQQNESKPGVYDVYLEANGTRLIVLHGLNHTDRIVTSPLQNAIHEHYAEIAFVYSLLFGVVLIYLTGLHIVIPVLRKLNLY